MGDIADTAQTVTIYWIFDIFFRLVFSYAYVDCFDVGAVFCSLLLIPVQISFLLRFSFSSNYICFFFFLYRFLDKRSFFWGGKLVHLTFFFSLSSCYCCCCRTTPSKNDVSDLTQNAIRLYIVLIWTALSFSCFFFLSYTGWSIRPGLEGLCMYVWVCMLVFFPW